MIFKNKYDLSLNDVSLLFERNDLSILKLSKFIPWFLVRKYYAAFILEFTDMFNPKEVSELIDQDMIRFKIANRVTLVLYPLYIGLMLSNAEGFKKIYKDMFGRPYNGIEDLKVIVNEIDRLKGKIKEMGTPEQMTQGRGKVSFEEVIIYVEAILDRGMDRNMKLYQFKFQYDLAIKRAKELEKINKK
jgi:hypothetical protein